MVSIRLATLTEEQFDSWMTKSIQDYAADKLRAGNYEEKDAIDQSRKEFEFLLPEGLNSKNNYIFSIVDQETNEDVGILWYNSNVKNDPAAIFIYDIEVWEDYRGKGYGTLALQLLEKKAKVLGKSKISLHVFGHNKSAITLYERLGYLPTNILMSKRI